jgi:hypothetical protein
MGPHTVKGRPERDAPTWGYALALWGAEDPQPFGSEGLNARLWVGGEIPALIPGGLCRFERSRPGSWEGRFRHRPPGPVHESCRPNAKPRSTEVMGL